MIRTGTCTLGAARSGFAIALGRLVSPDRLITPSTLSRGA
jgi:hypothetical protein